MLRAFAVSAALRVVARTGAAIHGAPLALEIRPTARATHPHASHLSNIRTQQACPQCSEWHFAQVSFTLSSIHKEMSPCLELLVRS
jgi:hypothetical protein